MASITIRNLEDCVKERLRVRAAKRGKSMEAEVRDILREAVDLSKDGGTKTLCEIVDKYFGPENGFDITPYLPKREPGREPPDFS